MQIIKGQVLFVGSDPDINKLIVSILNRAGCQASACLEADALELIAENDFDCVVVDWTDAFNRGTEFYKVVRCLARQTPVLFFTGVASGPEVKLGLSAADEESLATLSLNALAAAVL